MNKIIDAIKDRYLCGLHLVFAYGLITIFLFAGYRFMVHEQITIIYPDLYLLDLADYLILSLHYDALAVATSLILLTMMIFLLCRSGLLAYIFPSLLLIFQLFFLLFSVEFFRVYETSFQPNFAGREHFSGLGNVAESAIAEFSSSFYIFFFVITAMIVAMNVVIYLWDRQIRFSEIITMHSRVPLIRVLTFFIPVTTALLMILSFASKSESRYRNLAARINEKQQVKFTAILHELSMNPVYSLIYRDPYNLYKTASRTTPAGEEFHFGLNTDSLEDPKVYQRRSLIPRKKGYNIVLYFFESTPFRYLSLKVGDRYVTENWHRLMNNSFVSRNHHANYPLSANALLSVLTSAYDMNSKNMAIQEQPDIPLQSISQILKKEGYATCLIHTGGLGYAGQKRFLKNRMFDVIIDYDQLVRMPPYNRQVGWGIDERSMTKPALEFVRGNPGRPYLIVLLPVNPHHPYAIPDSTFKMSGELSDTAIVQRASWLNYINSLHYADAALGEFVDEFEKKGLLDNTLLFLFADHGEAFYQHRMNYNHPLFLYNENVHVPFLIYNKKIFPETVYFDGITRHIDILPTIQDILGIPSLPCQEGVPIFSAHREQLALMHTSWKDDYMAVRDGRWKYICRTKDLLEELYDIRTDPDERNNLAGVHADIAERYRNFVLKAKIYKERYYKKIIQP